MRVISDEEPFNATTSRRRRWIFLLLLGFLLVVIMAILPGLLRSMGGRISGARLERVRHSPHFADGAFHNTKPDKPITRRERRNQLTHWVFGGEQRVPKGEISVVARHASDYTKGPDSGLRLTWMGHATVLVEVDGHRILTDPVWSERASPLTWIGPKRFHTAPISLAELPSVDVVVISHDHYDHLDMTTIQILAARGTRFVVPLGVGAHLQTWGVPEAQVAELDWGDQAEITELKIIATPARHYSGRNPLLAGQTFWASWVIQGPTHRVFFSGDTGYTDDFKTVGQKYGPFDVTLMKVGASDPSWADIHMTPEQAVQAHGDLKGAVMLPIHWGTFNLAFHAWDEPADRVVAAARNARISLAVPRPGEFVEPNRSRAFDYWWVQGSVRPHNPIR